MPHQCTTKQAHWGQSPICPSRACDTGHNQRRPRQRRPHPGQEEIQLYQYLLYIMTQLIEKKALLERKRKSDSYIKHLERMKTMGEFASRTAHHLNNVLSVIIGKGQLLQKKLGEIPQTRDLELLIQAATAEKAVI